THLPATKMVDGRPGKPRSHLYYLVRHQTIPEWAFSRTGQATPAALEAKGHAGPFTKSFRDPKTRKEAFRLVGTGSQAVCPPSVWQKEGKTEVGEWEGAEPGEPAVVDFVTIWDAACRLAAEIGANVPEAGSPAKPKKPKKPKKAATGDGAAEVPEAPEE